MPRTKADKPAGDESGQPTVLVIGEGDLTDETVRALEALDARVTRLSEPSEGDVRKALDDGVDSVAVVARADPIVLRMALMVRAVSEDVPLLLTIFDPTMAGEVAREWSDTQVTSLADIVAPSLAGPCISERFTAVTVDDGDPVGLIESDGEVTEEPITSPKPHPVQAAVRDLISPYDKSAALLLFGALGLLSAFAVETVTAVFVLDESVVDATYGSAKTLVTVDPNPKIAEGPDWYKIFTSATMLVALVFAAGFTAGLVNRVIDRRLTGVLGRRAVPRRDHVVVVGLGQVGLRLCLLLRACGIPVVAVERDEEGENVGIAKQAGLPVVVGRGADQSLLRRLSLPHATAVAAVTADDLENISVAMAARAVHNGMHVVLRVGDGQVANETRSLLGLGLVRDVHRIAAAFLATMALGREVESVICLGEDAHLRLPDGRLERAALTTMEG
ncbi:MAG: NAD-binding protein [Actinomycetota bacterium]|nr:NAD-binding protein [Actinomycetota bacterium]